LNVYSQVFRAFQTIRTPHRFKQNGGVGFAFEGLFTQAARPDRSQYFFLASGLVKNDQLQITVVRCQNMREKERYIFPGAGMLTILAERLDDKNKLLSIDGM